METQLNSIDNCRKEVVFFFPNEELQAHYEISYRKWQPEVQLQGFRKGKAPMNMIKRMFGAKIETEVREELLEKALQDFFKGDEIKAVGNPKLISFEQEELGFRAKFEFDTIPDFQLGDYKGLTVDEPVHVVTESEVNEAIDQICKANGDFETADQVLNDFHVVGLNLQELDEATGLPIIGSKDDEISVYLADKSVIPEMRQALLNTKVGDTFNFNPSQYAEHAPNKLYKITVNDIQRLTPRELTDEFVADYTKGKLNTADEFRQNMEFSIQEKWDEKARIEVEKQIITKIVEMHDFDLPESILRNASEFYFNGIKDKYKNTDYGKNLKFEDMYPDLKPIAERNLRWEIIRNKIIKTENISIEEFDLDPYVLPEAQKTNSDVGTLREILMKNEQFVEQILAKKAMDFILDFAITNEVPYDDEKDDLIDEVVEDSLYDNEDNDEYDDDDDDEYDEHVHSEDCGHSDAHVHSEDCGHNTEETEKNN